MLVIIWHTTNIGCELCLFNRFSSIWSCQKKSALTGQMLFFLLNIKVIYELKLFSKQHLSKGIIGCILTLGGALMMHLELSFAKLSQERVNQFEYMMVADPYLRSNETQTQHQPLWMIQFPNLELRRVRYIMYVIQMTSNRTRMKIQMMTWTYEQAMYELFTIVGGMHRSIHGNRWLHSEMQSFLGQSFLMLLCLTLLIELHKY